MSGFAQPSSANLAKSLNLGLAKRDSLGQDDQVEINGKKWQISEDEIGYRVQFTPVFGFMGWRWWFRPPRFAMFRGNQPATVDPKGRLKLPEKFRRMVEEIYGPQFYVTSKDGERAELWPLKEWEKIEEALAKAPSSAAKQKLMDVTNYYGQQVDIDAQGRVLMPQLLREKASLIGDVAVLGQTNKLIVMNDGRAKDKIEANPLTGEDLDSLAVPGL